MDRVLSKGVSIWGVATDDVHQLKEYPLAGFSEAGRDSRPGRGWIVVRAKSLTVPEIMKAIEAGEFYASTGITLEDYQTTDKQITIKIKTNRWQTKYRTQFIGKNGQVLQDSTATSAAYKIKGSEGYVRARITDSNGKMAWTHPVFIDVAKAK